MRVESDAQKAARLTRGLARQNMLHKLIAMALSVFCLTACAGTAQKPPLVLEPNRHSYTFGVPDGWVFSFEQANSIGVRLVLFPKGENFHESNSIIYVNEISGNLSAAVDKTISNAKYDSPNIKIETLPSIPIKAGGRAAVRMITGYRDPRQAKEALAFIEHTDTVLLVVLTTKNATNWQYDYNALESVISGHKYFDCNSPNLAVPCR